MHRMVQIIALRHLAPRLLFAWVVCVAFPASAARAQTHARAWQRHTIDDSLAGADGARLADANGDGFLDVVTGWEESGKTCIYLHPGPKALRNARGDGSPWGRCLIGNTPAVEDAVWVDVNGDSALDVLVSCEGKQQSLIAFVAPQDPAKLLDASQWQRAEIQHSKGMTRWMFASALPAARNQRVVVGSKSPNGQLSILTLNPATPANSKIEKVVDASWIMSIETLDIDADGDTDVIYSDRKGSQSGVYWLENRTDGYVKHLIGGLGEEVMFLDVGKASEHTMPTVYVAIKPNRIIKFAAARKQDPSRAVHWVEQANWEWDRARFGRAKSVAIGKLHASGDSALIFSCEGAEGKLGGVGMIHPLLDAGLKDASLNDQPQRTLSTISGPAGIKFDFVELVDIDYDGDLDVLTCEERFDQKGLGLIWYENPAL